LITAQSFSAMKTQQLHDEVVALEKARLDALDRNDIDAIAQMMSEDLVHVHATGMVENRAQYLDGLRALPRRTKRENLHIILCGDQAAVLTGNVVNSLTRPGQTTLEQTRLIVTLVARREEGIWRFVSFHACRTPATG
jgi:ketosteroid isomerase-like protein